MSEEPEVSNTADSSIIIKTPSEPAILAGCPEDVLRDPRLGTAEKREILARWASDTHAVESAPALRRLDDGAIVGVDDVLAALRALDSEDDRPRAGAPVVKAFGRRRGGLLFRLRAARQARDLDDDDPPPRPAAAAYPVRIELADALAA